MAAERTIEVHALHWQGVDIEITYEACWLSGDPSSPFATAHVTVTAKAPDRARLPITETGYRSLFISREQVEDAGGPLTYVEAWLDHMARSREWRAYGQAGRQLSLF